MFCEIMMKKIAIPTREDMVDDHFGHCAYYTVVTLDDENQVQEKERLDSPEGCGCKSNIASVMQEAFQHGFQSYNKEDNKWQVLPDKDFYQSLETEGAEAYEAIDTDGQRVGGAIIAIDAAKHHGELSFLYVKVGIQSKGIGQAIWKAIESLHPETEVWETCTPYFDRRNIHFYINRLGFHAVEFFNEHHPDPHMPEQFDQEDGLFKFEKCV